MRVRVGAVVVVGLSLAVAVGVAVPVGLALLTYGDQRDQVQTVTVPRGSVVADSAVDRGSWSTRRVLLPLPFKVKAGEAPSVVRDASGARVLVDTVKSHGAFFDAVGRLGTRTGVHRLPGYLAAGPELYGHDRIAMTVVRTLRRGRRRRSRDRILVLLGRTDGRIERTLTVATERRVEIPEMAVSPRGDIAVIWTGCPTTELCEARQDVLVAVLPAGATRFEAPVRLLAHFDEEVLSWTPQFNARGDLVIAYVGDNGRVDLRVRRAGEDFGPERTLGEQDGQTNPGVAFDDRGRIAVAWTTQDGGEQTELPLRMQAVVGSAITGKLRDVQVLDRGPPPGDYGSYGTSGLAVDSGMRVLLDPSGRATAIWGQVTGLFASTSGRDGAFEPPTRITPARDPWWDTATAPDGRAIIAWVARRRIYARVRRAGARAFGPVELVSRAKPLNDVWTAFDRQTGRAVVRWARERRDHRAVLVTAMRESA